MDDWLLILLIYIHVYQRQHRDTIPTPNNPKTPQTHPPRPAYPPPHPPPPGPHRHSATRASWVKGRRARRRGGGASAPGCLARGRGWGRPICLLMVVVLWECLLAVFFVCFFWGGGVGGHCWGCGSETSSRRGAERQDRPVGLFPYKNTNMHTHIYIHIHTPPFPPFIHPIPPSLSLKPPTSNSARAASAWPCAAARCRAVRCWWSTAVASVFGLRWWFWFFVGGLGGRGVGQLIGSRSTLLMYTHKNTPPNPRPTPSTHTYPPPSPPTAARVAPPRSHAPPQNEEGSAPKYPEG